MLIESAFELPVGPDRAWELLTDVERVAPCMPGVELREQDGDRYLGRMNVKVGPVTARYDCSMRFASLDSDGRVAVLEAEGRELRGQGTAAATVTTRIMPAGDGSEIGIATDLAVTGRLAQFGRGMMEDVSNRLVDQFAERLRTDLAAPAQGANGAGALGTDGRPAPAPTATAAAPTRESEAEPLDLLGTMGVPPLRTIAVALYAFVLGYALGRASR